MAVWLQKSQPALPNPAPRPSSPAHSVWKKWHPATKAPGNAKATLHYAQLRETSLQCCPFAFYLKSNCVLKPPTLIRPLFKNTLSTRPSDFIIFSSLVNLDLQNFLHFQVFWCRAKSQGSMHEEKKLLESQTLACRRPSWPDTCLGSYGVLHFLALMF